MRTEIPKYIPDEPYKRIVSIMRSYRNDCEAIKQITDHDSKRYAELSRRITAVNCSLDKLEPEARNVIIQNMMDGIALEYCYTQKSMRTCQRWRKQFMLDLGYELGEI